MIDSPAPVILKSVPEIIPIGVLDAVRIKLPEYVDESPGDCLLVGVPGIDVEIDVVHAPVRMVDIDRFRSHVQVSKPDGGLARIEMFFEIQMHSPEPLQFELV